jgi:branched-chain amino acid transport system permease protein
MRLPGLEQSAIAFALINTLLAASYQLPMQGGVFILSGVAFMAIGAYASALLTVRFDVNPVVALAAAAALPALVAFLLSVPLARLGGLYLALSTLAFLVVVETFLLNAGFTGGAAGLYGIPRYIEMWHLMLAVLGLAYLALTVHRSRFGRAMAALRESNAVASALGVNPALYRSALFVVSGILAGLSGAFYAHYVGTITPQSFSFSLVVRALVMALLGGTRHWAGAFVGATVVTLLPELLRPVREWRDVVFGGLLVALILFAPRGIAGSIEWLLEQARGSLARLQVRPQQPLLYRLRSKDGGIALDDPTGDSGTH